MKSFFIFFLFLALWIPAGSIANAAKAGDLIRCADFSSVYYLAEDNKRYVFPNEKIYFSWYENFDDVVMISCSELASYALGDRVSYQAGTRLVKIPSIPTVYVVEPNGVLRAIQSEAQAQKLYGSNWAKRVDDLSEAFFPSYEVGAPLEDEEIPEGTVLQNANGNFYRVNEHGSATRIDELMELGIGVVLADFALSLEQVEDKLELEIELDEPNEAERDELEDELDTVTIEEEDEEEIEPAITKKYLLSFHACNKSSSDCSSPQNHKVYLAESDDGEDWELIDGWKPFKGSVPDVIRRNDTLYIYTADNVLVRYHLDTNEQDDPVSVDVAGLDDGFVDPSLMIDEDGRLVLFFLYGMMGGDPAQCASGQSSCVKYFGSATEVKGFDGEAFTMDSGHRAEVTLSTTGNVKTASDPDIFYDGDRYVLYISYGSSVSVWTSDKLQGEYDEQDDLLSENSGGIPAGFYDESKDDYWTFTHKQNSSGVSVISRAVHNSVFDTVSSSGWETILSASDVGLGSSYSVESPGFAVNEE